MKTGSARELEQFVTTFQNPEVASMAAIGHILEELPDAAARLRVMRWAFAKYSDEFKRPLPDAAPALATAPALAGPPTGPVLVVSTSRPAAPAAATPAPAVPMDERSIAADIEEQIAELNDLFPVPARSALDL